MIIAVLSPAKTLDYTSELPPLSLTEPRFAEEAVTLATAASKLSAKKLGTLMHISPKLATLNAERYADFLGQPERPALFAFAGDVYTGFDAKTLDDDALPFAQSHVRMLSGLYGLLRPLDAIRPYRLEMGTRWAPGRPKDLYQWWNGRIADMLAEDAGDDGTILNLASQEYWGAVKDKLPGGMRVIDIDFREPGPDGPRFISFNAKRARGMMARWMVEHRITDVTAMQGFDTDGYRFDPSEGTETSWRFTRTA